MGLLLILMAALSPAPTLATPQPDSVQAQVESLYVEGAALYKAGKHRAAIDKFEQAFALYPEPNLLYNMGRAYEAVGDVDQAIAKYRLCAAHPEAMTDVAAKALEKVAALEAARTSTTTAPQDLPAVVSTPITAVEPAPPGFPLWGVAGGGVAAIGAIGAAVGGVVFGMGVGSHNRIATAKEDLNGDGVAAITRVEAQRLADVGTTQKTVGVVALSVGGGLLLASIPLFVVQLVE